MATHARRWTQRHGWVWCAIAALLFGAATPAIKVLVDHVGSVTLAGLLYLGAAVAAVPFVLVERRTAVRAHVTSAQRTRLGLAVLLGSGLAPVLLVLALDRTPASTVALLLNLELVVTVVIARVFLREHIGPRTLLGMALVVVGGVVLAGGSGAGIATGALLVVATCVCWGIDNAITASLDRFSPARITLAKGAAAGTINLVLGTVIDEVPPLGYVLVVLAVGMVGYGLSITMWITGARLIGAARGQALFALAPFIGAVCAWMFIDEAISTTVLIAFTVSFVGVLVVSSARHGHHHAHDPIVHEHAIDPRDPHHRAEFIEVLSGARHRHLEFEHEHDHLPDIHHRHRHHRLGQARRA